MAIGDIVKDDGDEFQVVWSGGEPLLPPRDSIPPDTWRAPHRNYTKTGRYTRLPAHGCKVVDNSAEISDTNEGLIVAPLLGWAERRLEAYLTEEPTDGSDQD